MLLLAGGCATQSDLEKVRRDLAVELSNATARSQQEVQAIRSKVDDVQSRFRSGLEAERKVIEALRAHEDDLEGKMGALASQVAAVSHGVQTGIADLRKAIEDANAQRAEDLTTLRRTVTEIKQAVLHDQERLSSMSAAAQRLQSSFRSLATTIVRRYQLEVEGLRQNLKEMEVLAKELDTLSGPSPEPSQETRPSP